MKIKVTMLDKRDGLVKETISEDKFGGFETILKAFSKMPNDIISWIKFEEIP